MGKKKVIKIQFTQGPKKTWAITYHIMISYSIYNYLLNYLILLLIKVLYVTVNVNP